MLARFPVPRRARRRRAPVSLRAGLAAVVFPLVLDAGRRSSWTWRPSARCTTPRSWRGRSGGMLQDARSAAFIDGFLDSWLDAARPRFDAARPQQVRGRTTATISRPRCGRKRDLFTRHLLEQNLSIANFLDSDFTFVDKPLARHYGADSAPGPRVREGQPERPPPRRTARPGERADRDGQRDRHLAGGPRRLAAREHPRHAAVSAAARRRAARPGHPRRHDHPRTAGEAPERRQLLRLPSQDRPARLRAGEFRCDRRLARPLRPGRRRRCPGAVDAAGQLSNGQEFADVAGPEDRSWPSASISSPAA